MHQMCSFDKSQHRYNLTESLFGRSAHLYDSCGNKVWCWFSITHQLELSSAVVGALDAAVSPQGVDGGQIMQEDFGLYNSLRHCGWACVKAHQELPMCLVRRVSPRDVQLLSGINQHSDSYTHQVIRYICIYKSMHVVLLFPVQYDFGQQKLSLKHGEILIWITKTWTLARLAS